MNDRAVRTAFFKMEWQLCLSHVHREIVYFEIHVSILGVTSLLCFP